MTILIANWTNYEKAVEIEKTLGETKKVHSSAKWKFADHENGLVVYYEDPDDYRLFSSIYCVVAEKDRIEKAKILNSILYNEDLMEEDGKEEDAYMRINFIGEFLEIARESLEKYPNEID